MEITIHFSILYLNGPNIFYSEVLKMDKLFNKEFGLSGRDKEKWDRHILLVELFEKGVEIEEIAKIAGLSEEEMDEHFSRLY
jgi:hypothetical protein